MIESIALSVKRFREDLPCLYDVEVSDQKYVNQELADPFRRDAFKPTPTRLLEKYRSLSG